MTAFTIPPDLLAQTMAVVGKTGSGKTYTAKGLIERLLTDRRRVCILDPTGVWWGLKSLADGKRAGFPVAVFGGAHADVPIAETSGAALAKIVAEKNLPAVIDLSEMLIGQRHRFATDFAEALYRDNRSPLHLVIDEADEFAPQNPLPETRRMLHHFDRIVRRGRVRGFRVMLITQRPAVLHKNVLTQANALIALRLTAPQDRAALQAWVEGNADAAKAKEVIGSLAGLQRGQGWVWAPELGILERAQFPAITTFDSSRTPGDDETLVEPTNLAAVDLSGIEATLAVKPVEPEGEKQLRAELTKQRARVLTLEDEVLALESELAAVPKAPAISDALRAAVAQVAAGLQAVQEQIESAGDAGAAQPDVAPAPRQREAISAPAPRARAASPAPGPTARGLSGPQQRILDALAWFAAIGVDAPARSPLGAVAGSSPKSSGFEKNLSTLRTAGMIDYPSGGRVALTSHGRATANPPAHAPTAAALHEAIYQMISGPQAVILRVLVDLRGQPISREDLAARAGVSMLSSGFEKNISTLRSFELIDYPQRGQVQGTSILFPKGVGKPT
jgi:hypothetical protein